MHQLSSVMSKTKLIFELSGWISLLDLQMLSKLSLIIPTAASAKKIHLKIMNEEEVKMLPQSQ